MAPQRFAADFGKRRLRPGKLFRLGSDGSAFLAGDAGDFRLDHPVDDGRQIRLEPLRQHRPQHVAHEALERGFAGADDLRLSARLGEHREGGERFAHCPGCALGRQARPIFTGVTKFDGLTEIEYFAVLRFFGLFHERFRSETRGLALAAFHHRILKYVGAYAAVLGGLDAIAIGGGIGENAPAVRARICRDLEWLGVELDSAANDDAVGVASRITTARSSIAVDVVPVDEEVLIAERVRDSLPVVALSDDSAARSAS